VRHLLQYGGAALIVVEDQEHLQDARGPRPFGHVSGVDDRPPDRQGREVLGDLPAERDFRNLSRLRECRLEEFPPADTGITSIEHYAKEADPQ